MIFMLFAVFLHQADAANCSRANWFDPVSTYPECTKQSLRSAILCEIRFSESVANVPREVRVKLGLSLRDEPVSIDRRAVVWPGNGTPNPPAVMYHSGYADTAITASHSDVPDFQSHWPEAIVIYTEGSRLICHDRWNMDRINQIPFYSPRFPFQFTQVKPVPHTDLNYVDVLADRVHRLFPYDRKRLYAVGHSSGGFFTFSLMALRAKMFRAFAVLGAYADFGAKGLSDVPAIIKEGRTDIPRPVLYMMGLCENIYPWVTWRTDPACANKKWSPQPVNRVIPTIRQLAARNGARVPDKNDVYLRGMVNKILKSRTKMDLVQTKRFLPSDSSGGEEVVLKIYAGIHAWPPRRTDESLQATQWIIDFFRPLK